MNPRIFAHESSSKIDYNTLMALLNVNNRHRCNRSRRWVWSILPRLVQRVVLLESCLTLVRLPVFILLYNKSRPTSSKLGTSWQLLKAQNLSTSFVKLIGRAPKFEMQQCWRTLYLLIGVAYRSHIFSVQSWRSLKKFL